MKKRILSLILCVSMLAGVLVGCGGAGSQDTFLSKILADESIDLTDTGRREIKDFCNSQDVPVKEDEIAAFEITDLFLDYDSVYKLSFGGNSNYNPEENEWENLMINSITIDIKFENEKDVDSGISKIRQHLTSKIGATQTSAGKYDSYKLFLNENDEIGVYAKITCSVEKEKTAVIKIDFECFPTENLEIIKAFIDKVPNSYFDKGYKCVMVKPSGDDEVFLFFDNLHPMNIYRYKDGKVEEIENETISAFGTMKLLEDNQIALSGFGDDAGKYALYLYENGGLTLVNNIDKKTYESYIGIERSDTIISEYSQSYDSIIDAYNNMIDWEKELELLKEEEKKLACIKYVESEFSDYLDAYYNMADFDGDGFKEVIYDGDYGKYLLAYYDGKVIKSELPAYGYLLYKPNENTLVHYNDGRGFEDTTYFHLEKGKLVVDLNVSCMYNSDGDKVYLLNDENITKEEYEKYYINIYAESIDWTYLTDIRYYNEIVSELSK